MTRLVRRQFALFLCIGLGATAVHVVIAAYLIGTHMMPPALGNTIAFVFANLFSYFSQSTYVFQRPPTPAQYWRFLSVSLVGLAVVAAISSGLEVLGVHYLAGIAAVVLIVPIATFGLHSLWTFRDDGEGEAYH
ncbi:MAG: rane protein [Burkholderiales bacterium]|nr:rane protein [Burkholderiales bacterium]